MRTRLQTIVRATLAFAISLILAAFVGCGGGRGQRGGSGGASSTLDNTQEMTAGGKGGKGASSKGGDTETSGHKGGAADSSAGDTEHMGASGSKNGAAGGGDIQDKTKGGDNDGSADSSTSGESHNLAVDGDHDGTADSSTLGKGHDIAEGGNAGGGDALSKSGGTQGIDAGGSKGGKGVPSKSGGTQGMGAEGSKGGKGGSSKSGGTQGMGADGNAGDGALSKSGDTQGMGAGGYEGGKGGSSKSGSSQGSVAGGSKSGKSGGTSRFGGAQGLGSGVHKGGGSASYKAGDLQEMSIGGVPFNMIFVPAKSFPTGTNNKGTARVSNSYWTGQTEVTYELWKVVRDWATKDNGNGKRVDGGELYYFANLGRKGGDNKGEQDYTNKHPVTNMNWRDAIVWCNALTEYFNSEHGATLECAYRYKGVAVRDSRDTNGAICDKIVTNPNAKGFRLLSSNEWELAARWKGSDNSNRSIEYPAGSGNWWVPGNYPSGGTAVWSNKFSTDAVAVYGFYWNEGGYSWDATSIISTAEVKSKAPNALGIYDMSGNVWEWCFDLYDVGAFRIRRGGSWNINAVALQVGSVYCNVANSACSYLGFRFARTE